MEEALNEVREVKPACNVSEDFIRELISISLQGQTASTRLDSVIRYVMATTYLDRDTVLLLAGVNPSEVTQSENDDGEE